MAPGRSGIVSAVVPGYFGNVLVVVTGKCGPKSADELSKHSQNQSKMINRPVLGWDVDCVRNVHAKLPLAGARTHDPWQYFILLASTFLA